MKEESEETEIDLLILVKNIWSDRKRVVIWGLVAAMIGVIIALSIPRQWSTTVKIAPEGSTGKSQLSSMSAMVGLDLGATNGADGISPQIYPEIVHSTPFLFEVANMSIQYDEQTMRFYDYATKERKSAWWSMLLSLPFKLFSSKDDDGSQTIDGFKPSIGQNEYIALMRELVVVDMDKKSGIITISTTMQDPTIAAYVADSVLSKLQRYMFEYKTSKARFDLANSEQMLSDAKEKYYDADMIYAAAQDQNRNIVLKSAQIKLERLANERNLAFATYQQLATQVEISKIKVQEQTPIATVIQPASVPTRPVSPKRSILVLVFGFLGCLAGAVPTVIRSLSGSKNDESESEV